MGGSKSNDEIMSDKGEPMSAGEFWAVVAAVAGGVCCAILLTAIIVVLCRMRGAGSARLTARPTDSSKRLAEQVRLRQHAHTSCSQV